MAVCRLCLQEKELCKKSHIIPDFMYQELFDEKHRIFKGTPITGKRPKTLQSGEREGELLCRDCDNAIIGGYEAYASKALYEEKSLSIENLRKADDGLEITVAHGLDYAKFKLFLLSLLWRASVSSLPFFTVVALGPYEEKLRTMILTGDPGPSSCFPCVISSYMRTGLPTGVISAPRKGRLADGKTMYTFVISSMVYTFRVVEEEQTDWILEVAVNELGDLHIPHTPTTSAGHLFNKILGAEVFPT